MNGLEQLFGSYGGSPISPRMILISLGAAVILSQAVAATYVWTFRGLSYSSGFVHALSIGGIVACMLMLALNNNIAAGLGIAGSLAIIRFRTAMRDPRDMVFVFASMGAGIAVGLRAYEAGAAGVAVFCIAEIFYTWSEFGRQEPFDGLLRFHAPPDCSEETFAAALSANTRFFALASLRESAQGTLVERAYQIRLKNGGGRDKLVRALEKISGVSGIALLLQEPTVDL